MARNQRVHADIRPDQTGVDVDGLGRNQSRRLAMPYDTREVPAKDVLAPTLPDARQGGMIRQCLVQGGTDEPADRQIDLRLAHQAPVMDNPKQKARQHQAYHDFGIDAGAAIVGTVKIDHLGAKPPKVENLIDLHQHMVIGDQIPQRPGDEKFQLPALLPARNRSLPSTDTQSESEAWDFFNSPRGIISAPNA